MAKLSANPRIIADTATCFEDFIGRYPLLPVIDLIAEFCRVETATVDRWVRGQHWPGGEALVRLRCFLFVANYDVTEITRLDQEKRLLTLMIGLGIIDPYETEQALGYNTTNAGSSIWRITLHGQGYTKKVGEQIQDLVRSRYHETESAIAELERRIADTVRVLTAVPPAPVATVPVPFDPELALTFSHLVTATASLGSFLHNAGEARSVRNVTRGGTDIQELIGILKGLLEA